MVAVEFLLLFGYLFFAIQSARNIRTEFGCIANSSNLTHQTALCAWPAHARMVERAMGERANRIFEWEQVIDRP